MILLRDVIERNEMLYPDSVHSVFGERRLTFRQFATRARKLSDGLYRLGLRHQERVAILAMNCVEYLEAYAVAELSGVILATVNWRVAPPEIAIILKDSAPKALIFERQFADLVDRLKPELRGVEHFICITDPGADGAPPGALSYEHVLAAGDSNGAPIRADLEGGELPRGQIGELMIRSPSTMRGYWNNDVATIDTVRNGWLHTGDMGYVDEEGYIFLVDRKKDMIISGGENIYCQEVEDALIDHPGLSEVAIIGVPDEKWGEAVKAIAVRAQGSVVSEVELFSHCRERIAGFKCPKSIVFTDELPRLPSGKVNKVVLRQRHTH